MANDWIKMRINLGDDPAVIGISARTNLDKFSVVGRLYLLWSWADEQSDDGHMPFVDGSTIDSMTKRAGFAAAMVSVGWLLIEEGGVIFPKFSKHNGDSAKKRAMETEKKRLQRLGKCPEPVPEKSGQNRDNCGTREEKRREEKNRIENTSKTVGVGANSSVGTATPPTSDSPRAENSSSLFPAPPAPEPAKQAQPKLTDAEWLGSLKVDPTFAHVDIDYEHGKMLRWCELKHKQPTRTRFLRWIGRIEKPMTGQAPGKSQFSGRF
jgi:hypothetical protein